MASISYIPMVANGCQWLQCFYGYNCWLAKLPQLLCYADDTVAMVVMVAGGCFGKTNKSGSMKSPPK